MLTEEQFLKITTEILELTVDPWLRRVQAAYNFSLQYISVELLDSKLNDLLDGYDTRSFEKQRILSSNQSRLIKADTLEWNTDAGSVTYDVDVLLDSIKKQIYLLLNMDRYGIPLELTDNSNMQFIPVGRG